MYARVLQDNIESCSDTTWLNLSQCRDTWASTFNYYILFPSTLNAHFAMTLDPLFNNCAKHLQARICEGGCCACVGDDFSSRTP